jgi:ATP-dependent DNA helicase PIF1
MSPELIQMLNDLRVGTISESSVQLFRTLSRPLAYTDGIIPTELFPRRYLVEESNKRHLDCLDSRLFTFNAKDTYGYDYNMVKITPTRGKAMLDRIVAPSIQLKVDLSQPSDKMM